MATDVVGNRTEVVMYAVFRNGVRVSDAEYDSKMGAQTEYLYWAGILKRNPDGSKLEVRSLNQNHR
jgi:hypothetical protein